MTAALDRAVANALGLKSVNNCEKWGRTMDEAQPAQEPVALVIDGVLVKSALPEKYTGHLYTTPPATQPAQEPVAWITPHGEGFRIRFSAPTNDVPLGWDALYTTPPKREWVGLTGDEIVAIENECEVGWSTAFARAIEAKLKEKNT